MECPTPDLYLPAESGRLRFRYGLSRRVGARSARLFLFGLFALAAGAPFLANDRPYAVRIDGRWHFPLFDGLDPADFSWLLATFVVGFVLLFLLPGRLSQRKGDRRGMLLTGRCIIFVLLLAAAIGGLGGAVLRLRPSVDYRGLLASGRAERAYFAPVPFGYDRTDLAARERPPDRVHYLGTDDVGADVLARLIHGSRISLTVGLAAVTISGLLGIAVGLILGYYGGRVDLLGMRLLEIVMSIPPFFLMITMVAFFPRSLFNMIVIIGITSWTTQARLVRAECLKLRDQEFLQAARALGLTRCRILVRHLLPHAVAPVLVHASFAVAGAIFLEAAFSFLGFGLAPPAPSWGQMLSVGISSSGRFLWWLSLFPGLAIFLTVLSCNVLGIRLRDRIDPQGVRVPA
ncbi:MAG: ABC transporter permease [Sedimentisphaerales bacterium]|nr:ABC transporter permease [Sedimentisphaerales bacterium]